MTSAISVPSRDLINYPPEFSDQVIDALTVASSEITALQGSVGALDWKNSAVAATTGALPANTRTGNVLTADANGALGAQDGIALVVGERLLVKNEVTQANNGIYDVTSLGSAGTPWVLTRSSDADETAEVTPNLAVAVERGASNGDKVFMLDIDGPVVLNTTALVFVDWRGLAITAPVDVTKAAAAVGTSAAVARADHKHDVSTGTPGASAIGDAAAEGVATSLARSDHAHSIAGGSPVAVGAANADGVAVTFARADHVHDHGAQTEPTQHAVATGALNGFMSSTDKTKLDTIQTGSVTLVLGTQPVATANITASSIVEVSHGALNGSTALGILAVSAITPGTPGSFVITAHIPASAATETNDISTIMWKVTN